MATVFKKELGEIKAIGGAGKQILISIHSTVRKWAKSKSEFKAF